ncbi:MAG: flagellar hook-basal body protein [Syntrophobacteraceae bacterium]
MGIGTAMYNGVSGLNSFSSAMGTVSDNIANSASTGFKSNSINFGDMVNSYYSINSNDTEGAGSGSIVLGVSTDWAQGTILNSSQWSNVCMSGEGFFVLNDPITSRVYYTRDGAFHLDGGGNLVNLQGLIVQDINGGPLNVPNQTDYITFRIETDGMIYGTDSTGAEVFLGQMGLATFSNKDGLVRQGNNLYMAGPEVGVTITNSTNPGNFGQILDYSLEGSNVDIAKQMVDMIIYQADYNANSKTITTCQNMMDTTINMVR